MDDEQENIDRISLTNIISSYKPFLIAGTLGILLLIVGLRIILTIKPSKDPVEFIIKDSEISASVSASVKIEIAGAVVKPGVYALPATSRIQDLLLAGGGLSQSADRKWVSKYVNLAAIIRDGQKVYIPEIEENVTTSSNDNQNPKDNYDQKLININSASLSELEDLPGVGEVTANKIILGRSYSEVSDLITKKIINQSTFDKIKDLVSVY